MFCADVCEKIIFFELAAHIPFPILKLKSIYDTIIAMRGKDMRRDKFYRVFTILLLIISLSLFSCVRREPQKEQRHSDPRKHFSTEYFYCTLKDEYLTITGFTPAAKELEELTIPIYIAEKCVTELIIDSELEQSNIKKIYVQHPVIVDFDKINNSSKKFILNFDVNFDAFGFIVSNSNFLNDLNYLHDYLNEFVESKVILSPEMSLQFAQTFLATNGMINDEELEDELDDIEDELYEYIYLNKITNISYRYNIEAAQHKYYWADFAAPGDKILPPPDPALIGYIFGGWYTDAALTNLYDFDSDIPFEDTSNTEEQDPIEEGEQEQLPEEEPFQPFLLYAKWVSRG